MGPCNPALVSSGRVIRNRESSDATEYRWPNLDAPKLPAGKSVVLRDTENAGLVLTAAATRFSDESR